MNMRPAFWLSMAALTVAVACDSGIQDPSPTSPAFSASAGSTRDGKTGGKGTTTTTVTVKGAITGLGGTCPTLTFTLDGKTIKTSTATSYSGGGCADVKNDAKIAVAGTAQADGSILAAQVRIGTTTSSSQVKVDGTVSGLGGTCPTLTFTLDGKTIKTSAATSYSGGTCADVKNDAKIAVAGAAQADGSILAAQVRIGTPTTEPAIKGAITALAGTCPALTITVVNKTATTTGATVFTGKACGGLTVGVEVAIYGAVPPGGSTLVATIVRSRK